MQFAGGNRRPCRGSTSVSLDPYVFGFTMGVAVVAAVLFGAAPAITGSRANLDGRAEDTSPGISGLRDHRLLRNTFVVGEIALALVLLIAAGLLVRSFRGIMRTDPGYDPHNVLTASVQLPLDEGAGPLASQCLPADAGIRGRSVAEIESSARGTVRRACRPAASPAESRCSPWFGSDRHCRRGKPGRNLRVPLIGVTPDFFRAMGTRIVQGREFRETTTKALREWRS